jgi:hypothetical protein
MHHPTAAAVQLISKHAILCFKWALQIDWISTRLARTLPDHPREAENYLKRLEQVLQLAGLKAQGIDGPKEAWSPFSMQRQRRR